MANSNRAQQLLTRLHREFIDEGFSPDDIPTPEQFAAMRRRTVELIEGEEVNPTEADFEKFYDAFPVQSHKEAAREEYWRAFQRVKRKTSEHPRDVLLRAAEQYDRECIRHSTPDEKVTWPQRWLKDDSWYKYGVKVPGREAAFLNRHINSKSAETMQRRREARLRAEKKLQAA